MTKVSRYFNVKNKITTARSRSSYIILSSHFKMEIVQPKQFQRPQSKTTVDIPVAKGQETAYAFHWPLFNAQAHAVTPFETNKPSRDGNTARSGNRTHEDKSSSRS